MVENKDLQEINSKDKVINDNLKPRLINKKPILMIDIDIGPNQKDRITIYKNDDPREVSIDFCQKHQLDDDTQKILENQLVEKM